MTGATNPCLLHVPGHSYENCKLLEERSKKYAIQRPHKENEARSGEKTKGDKSVELKRNLKEVNITEYDDPIPRKKKGNTS